LGGEGIHTTEGITIAGVSINVDAVKAAECVLAMTTSLIIHTLIFIGGNLLDEVVDLAFFLLVTSKWLVLLI